MGQCDFGASLHYYHPLLCEPLLTVERLSVCIFRIGILVSAWLHSCIYSLELLDVEEFNYTTLSIVFSATINRRGRAYWILIIWNKKMQPITWPLPNFTWRNLLLSFTLGGFPCQLQFSVPPLGAEKKNQSPIFSRQIVVIPIPFDRAHLVEQNPSSAII